ncbi:MAG: protein kinase [Planctomycetes bacterium]|nr:protein kinase [Planctomycetota bacterium]
MNDDIDMPASGPVQEILERYLLDRANGVAAPVGQLLAEHPEHAEDVRRHLEVLQRAGLLASLDDRGGVVELPEVFDDFDAVRRIGAGGMGAVYEAHQITLDRTVALKLLHVGDLADPIRRERFDREIEILARVQHRNVVAVHGRGFYRQIPFLVMQRVRGQPLSEWISESEMPARERVRRITEIGAVLARALQRVHDYGVLHRDVKPSNVLLDDDQEPVLIDFGLAHDAVREGLTGTGDRLGTPGYRPPEQARGERVDGRADVFGLGATLHKLLCGRLPASAEGGVGQGVTARRLNRAVSRELDEVLRCATAAVPEQRYADCVAMADDLQSVLDGRPVRASRYGLGRLLLQWVRREPYRAALAGAVVALLALTAFTTSIYVRSVLREQAERRQALLELLEDTQIRWDSQIAGGSPEAAVDPRQEAAIDELRRELPDHPGVALLSLSPVLAPDASALLSRRSRSIGPEARELAQTAYRRVQATLCNEPVGELLDAVLLAGVAPADSHRTVSARLGRASAEEQVRYARALVALDRDAALGVIEEIVDAHPDNIMALRLFANLTRCRTSLAALGAAEAVYRARPDLVGSRRTLAIHRIRMARELKVADRRSVDQAIEWLREDHLRAPDDPTAAFYLALGLAEAGGPDGWQRECERLYRIGLRQHGVVARFNLANLLFNHRKEVLEVDREEVLRFFRSAADDYGYIADMWWSMAILHQELGDPAAGVEVLRKGIEQAADTSNLEIALLESLIGDGFPRDDAETRALVPRALELLQADLARPHADRSPDSYAAWVVEVVAEAVSAIGDPALTAVVVARCHELWQATSEWPENMKVLAGISSGIRDTDR